MSHSHKGNMVQARRRRWAGLGEIVRIRDLGRLSLWHGKEHRGVQVRGESSASPDITDLQSLELKHEYKGERERGCCIPRTNHCTANNRVELRVRWNKFVWAAFWKVDSQYKDRFNVVHTNFHSCPFDWQADFQRGLLSFVSSTAWRKSTMLTVNAG